MHRTLNCIYTRILLEPEMWSRIMETCQYESIVSTEIKKVFFSMQTLYLELANNNERSAPEKHHKVRLRIGLF